MTYNRQNVTSNKPAPSFFYRPHAIALTQPTLKKLNLRLLVMLLRLLFLMQLSQLRLYFDLTLIRVSWIQFLIHLG